MKVLVRSLELHRTASTIAAESLRGLSESDRERTILFYQRGTRIEVEDADVSEFLAELAQRLAAEGGVVPETPAVGPRPRVFISYAREDGALASRLFEALDRSSFEPWLDEDALVGGGELGPADSRRARGNGLRAYPLHAGALQKDRQLRQSGNCARSQASTRRARFVSDSVADHRH